MKEERQQCRPHEKESLSIVESDRGEKYQYTRVRERRGGGREDGIVYARRGEGR